MAAQADNRIGVAALAGLLSGVAALSLVLSVAHFLLIPTPNVVTWSVLPVMAASLLALFYGPVDDSEEGTWVYPIVAVLGVLSLGLMLHETWVQDQIPIWTMLLLTSSASTVCYKLLRLRPRPMTAAWKATRQVFCFVGAGIWIALTWPMISLAGARVLAFARDPLRGVGAEVSMSLIVVSGAALLVVVIAVFGKTIDSAIDAEERRELERRGAHG